MRVADYIFDFFVKKGVTSAFLVPGGGAMFLNDALAQQKRIKIFPNHNEQATTIAAEANARIEENIGLAVVTSGPGGTNAITGIAGAWLESVPLVVITGQVKLSDLKRTSGVRQKGPQEIDITSLVKPITKYAKTVMSKEYIRYELEKAYYLATSGRMGPVLLDIPLDIQAATIVPKLLKKQYKPKAEKKVIINFEKINQMLINAKRPLFLIGHGVRLSKSTSLTQKLINKYRIPFVTTWNASDLLPYDHSLNIGRPGSVALRAPNFAIQNCDLLISVGARLDNVVTAFNSKNFAKNAKKILVDIDSAELKKFNHHIDYKICCSADIFLKGFIKEINVKKLENISDWQNKCEVWKYKYSINDGKPIKQTTPISHLYFIDKLSEAIDPNTLIVTGSSGLAIESFYTAFRNKKNQRIFLTSALGAMGYGIPALLGASASNKFKNVVCVESDGSFMMNLQEMASLTNISKDLKIIIMNNGGYSSIRNTQKNYFNSRFISIDKKSRLHIPDLTTLAKSFNFQTFTINNPKNLSKQLKNILNKKGKVFCEVILKQDDMLWPKSSAIPLDNGKIISMPLEDMSPLLSRKELKEQMVYPLSKESMKIKN